MFALNVPDLLDITKGLHLNVSSFIQCGNSYNSSLFHRNDPNLRTIDHQNVRSPSLEVSVKYINLD